MAQFVAINTSAEVNGETILSVVKGMAHYSESALRILAENGIQNPEPGKWYPQQSWLNAFKTISESIGDQTLNQIGKQIPNSAQWPPQVNSIETALASIDIAFHMNHRINGNILFDPSKGAMSEGIGHYAFTKVGAKEVQIKCDNSYPCEFDKGLLKGVVDKFMTPDIKNVSFKHSKDSCRKNGQNECLYSISWE